MLQREIAPLLKRPVGRPPKRPVILSGIPHGDLRQLVRRYQDEGENYRLTPVVAQIMTGEAANSGTHLKVEAGAEGQVIADLHATRKPRGSYFIKDVVPAIPGEPTGYPSVVVNRFGNGTSLYFAGQPDQLFNRQGHPDYERLLVNAVDWASPEPPVRVEAPKTIEATYWELEQGGYLVHLLNHTYPGFPILGVFRLKGQPKRDGSIIVRSCKASQSPGYPIRDAFAVVEHPSCPSSSSSCPLPVG